MCTIPYTYVCKYMLYVFVWLPRAATHTEKHIKIPFANKFDGNKCCHGDECRAGKHDVVVKCGVRSAPSELIQRQRGGQTVREGASLQMTL